MHVTGEMAGRVATLALGITVAGWLLVRSLRRSEEPGRLVVKWLLTLPVLVGLVALWRHLNKVLDQGLDFGAAFFCGIGCAVLGLVLAIIWRRNIAAAIARPFASIYDGGSQQLEPHPLYSIAQAKRKRGFYTEAIREIRKQLEKFPEDVEGQLMLAEIQAENLNDLPGAEVTIQRLCNQPGHPPRNIALALNSLADWHLKFGQDCDAARGDLEKIIALLPDSEWAARAAQRIGHLANANYILSPHDRRPVAIAPGVPDLGLRPGAQHPRAPEVDPEKEVADCVNHLQSHPLDTEVRERLAVLYAEHYHRLDLAADQLEQLIAHPNQPGKNVAHWLNLLADLQVRNGGNYETVRRTVQRIIDRFPDTAVAQSARRRIDYLKLEIKGKEQGTTVKLGAYEQDIGLKKGH